MASIAEAAAELRDIARGFEAAPPRVAEQMRTVTAAVGHRVEALAKQLAPVDTGLLRSSIGTDVTRGGDTVKAEIGTYVHYAVFQELGTRYMAPNAFLGPSFDRNVGDFTDALQAVIVPEPFR